MTHVGHPPAKPLTDEEAEKGLLAWKALMDFGWRFCLEVFPQLRPEEDPLERLREIYRRMGEEHLRANERMLEVISGAR